MKDAGPTAVMRMEHGQIQQLLEAIGEAIGKRDPGASIQALVEVLTAHNQKEENVLYPWLDRALSAQETADLLQRMKDSQVNV